MIFALVQVRARDIDDESLMVEDMFYVHARRRTELAPASIRYLCDCVPELDSSATRFEAVVLALTRLSDTKAPGRRRLAAFLRTYSRKDCEALLDDDDDAAAPKRAHRVQASVEPFLANLADYLNGQERNYPQRALAARGAR